ncbi:GntR family transcriptional regulator [Alkalihalophilus pseudofirmus]|uniref:GntR family transcriptional regulator n=1 Tax=Alkalihalophilus pseudofirmus TaxID=79885 RepID=UPI0009517DBC|nr:GntR family transcriptional regulator [Alkalihalophilus pseudofirmus]
MEPNKFSDNSLSTQIAKKITQQIISGELQPGEKLSEYMYADEFGTSRAPVREALYLLTIEGLVERIPRKGALVKGYSPSEIFDLLEIRTMLEELAMKRIKERGVQSISLERMNLLLDKMYKEEDSRAYTHLNHDFHMCLIEMSGSEIISKMYERLEMPLLSIQNMSFSASGNIEKSIKEHKLLLQLLQENQVEVALELLNKHNRDVIESIQKQIKDKQK